MRLCSTMWAYVIAQTGYVVRLIGIQGGAVGLGKKKWKCFWLLVYIFLRNMAAKRGEQ